MVIALLVLSAIAVVFGARAAAKLVLALAALSGAVLFLMVLYVVLLGGR